MGRGGRGGGGRSGGSFGGGGRSGGSFGGSGRGFGSSGRAGRGGGGPSLGGGSRPSTPRPSGGGIFGGGAAPRQAPAPRRPASGLGTFGAGVATGALLGGAGRRRNTWGRRGGGFRGGGFHRGGIPRGGGFGGGGGRRGNAGCNSGCLQTIFIALLLVIVIAVVVNFFNPININNIGGTGGDVTVSTIERTALPLNAADSNAPTFVDNLNWIDSAANLNRGLTLFHQRTGVRPLLYLTDNVNGNAWPTNNELQTYAEARYTELIGDNPAHILLLFIENYAEDYAMWLVVGAQAMTIMDNEAQNILMDFINRYYYSDLDEANMFAQAFDSASERIMQGPPTPASPVPVFVTIGIIIILLILFTWWKRKQAQKNLEAEQTAEILSKPLEAFDSDDPASQLAKQYEDS